MSLEASQLVAGYRHSTILGPLDLHLPAGQLVCLIGANGAGKSTLIRTLCGMQSALSGAVLVGGLPMAGLSTLERAKKLAVVLTERVNATLMTGYELASYGRYPHLGWGGRLSADDHEIVRTSLVRAGATALTQRLVSEMSDGERQKIMIARALAQQPELLVLDEATSFLDLPRRIEMMQLLQNLAHHHNLAILLSTHDLELALRYADRLWLIDGERHLHAGGPEDLALQGVLSSTFSAEGLTFDLERGELKVGRIGHDTIRLEGSGIRAIWASRALNRAGFHVAKNGNHRVRVDADEYHLDIVTGETFTFSSLSQLADKVSSLTKQGVAA